MAETHINFTAGTLGFALAALRHPVSLCGYPVRVPADEDSTLCPECQWAARLLMTPVGKEPACPR